MSDRNTWATTTHVWADDVDREHLGRVRRELRERGAAGGVRHLVLEVLAYAQDEAASAGRRGSVVVEWNADESVTVGDDGRGTDTRVDDQERVVRKPVMATADVRFTNPGTAPVLPDGRPRRGMSAVAALSDVLVHENHRVDGSWAQTYRYGVPDDELAPIPARERSGTVVTFHADVDGPYLLTEADLTAFPDLDITTRGRAPGHS